MAQKIHRGEDIYMKHAIAELSMKYESLGSLPPEQKLAMGFHWQQGGENGRQPKLVLVLLMCKVTIY